MLSAPFSRLIVCEIAKGRLFRAAPFVNQLFSLEVELQSKLNKPWIVGRGNAPKIGTTNVTVRVTKVGVVEDIEELRSEFEDLVLAYPGALHQRKVEVDVARSMEHVATERTKPACPRINAAVATV